MFYKFFKDCKKQISNLTSKNANFLSKNQIFKPDKNTQKYQNGQKKLSAVFYWSIFKNLKNI